MTHNKGNTPLAYKKAMRRIILYLILYLNLERDPARGSGQLQPASSGQRY